MRCVAMANSFSINLLIYRLAETRDRRGLLARPEYFSASQVNTLFADSFQCIAKPARGRPILRMLRRPPPEHSDPRAKGRALIVCAKSPFRATFSWHKAGPDWLAQPR